MFNAEASPRGVPLAGTEVPGSGWGVGGAGGGRVIFLSLSLSSGKGRLYQTLHCHHQSDSCIKMGSGESRFNVSFIVRNKVTRQCPQTTTSEERERGDSRSGIEYGSDLTHGVGTV